jgi:hypothetical protein
MRDWEEQSVWLDAWRALLATLERKKQLKWARCSPTAASPPGEKRESGVGKTQRGKGRSGCCVVDGAGVPLGDHLGSASPTEVIVTS